MNINWGLKKILMTLGVAVLAATSSYAIPRGPDNMNNDVVCDDQIKPGPFAFTFAKDLGLSCPSDFYFFGSFLWLQPQEDGLEYAIENQANTTPELLPLTGGTYRGFAVENHSWDWNPGFRVGFGVYLNHDAWNIDVSWTYARIKDDSSYNHQGAGAVVPLWIPSGADVSPAVNKNASARWKGDFNTIDFSLLKPFHVSRYFVLNPTFALRGAIIDQDYTARYGGAWVGNAQDGAKMRAHNDFWGFGPKAGLKTEWILGNNFNLYGDVAASILFGKFDISQSMDLYTYDYDLDWKFYTTVPTFEAMFGINWGHFFNKNKCLFSIKAGFEFHQWWDQNRLVRFTDSQAATTFAVAGAVGQSHNDLSLIGFNFGFQFDF